MRVCNCSMFCCTLLYVHSSFAIILVGKGNLVALHILSSWCLLMVVWLFLVVPWACLLFVIVVFPDHNHFLFLGSEYPLYLLYMNNKTGDWTLKHGLHRAYELEMPPTRSHTVLNLIIK